MAAPVFRVKASPDGALSAINIELWGFKDCKLVRPVAMASALQMLPTHQLEGLKKISYQELATIPGLARWIKSRKRSKHRGRYDHDEQAITLHRCRSRAELFHTLFHELGHFVYFRIISSYEKKQWVTEVFPLERPVTTYGRRNAAEDFAEAFALFVLDAQRLAGMPLKMKFIRSVAFRERSLDRAALQLVIRGQLSNDKKYSLDTRV